MHLTQTVSRWFRDERKEFDRSLHQILAESGTSSWAVVDRYNRLLDDYVSQRDELLPHLTNYLNFAGSLLPLPSPEFLKCTNVLIAAGQAECLPAQRLLNKGFSTTGLASLRQHWETRLTNNLALLFQASVNTVASNDLSNTLSEYTRFRVANPEIEPLVLNACCTALGEIRRGDLAPDQVEVHQPLLRQLASNGCGEAYRLLGDKSLSTEPNQAIVQYIRAAELGSPHAMCQLGHAFARGLGSGGVDWLKAFQWYDKAVTNGHFKAKLHLGRLLLQEYPVPPSAQPTRKARGLALLKSVAGIAAYSQLPKSDADAHVEALETLGRIYLKGLSGEVGKTNEGIQLLKTANERGGRRAALMLGAYFLNIEAQARRPLDEAEGRRHMEAATHSLNTNVAENALETLVEWLKGSTDPEDLRLRKDYMERLNSVKSRNASKGTL